MLRTIKMIGIIGFLLCLLIMYLSDHGIRGIQKYDRSFRLLDMRFRYNSKTVTQPFDQISNDGRIAYQKYLVLDFIFIAFFLITMIMISDVVFMSPYIRTFLYILCGLRAIFDIIENLLLLRMLGQYPIINDNIAAICSWFTTFKFIMLYLWILLLIIKPIIRGINYLAESVG